MTQRLPLPVHSCKNYDWFLEAVIIFGSWGCIKTLLLTWFQPLQVTQILWSIMQWRASISLRCLQIWTSNSSILADLRKIRIAAKANQDRQEASAMAREERAAQAKRQLDDANRDLNLTIQRVNWALEGLDSSLSELEDRQKRSAKQLEGLCSNLGSILSQKV